MLNQVTTPFKTAKALLARSLFIKKTRKNIIYLKLFHQLGLASNYFFVGNKIKIYFNFVKHRLFFSFIRVFKKRTKQMIIKKKLLNKLSRNNSIIILLENAYEGSKIINKNQKHGGIMSAIIHN